MTVMTPEGEVKYPNAVGSSALIPPSLTASIGIQPIQQGANTAAGQGNRAVSCSVINIDGVSIGVHRVSAWEHDIFDVAIALVLGLRPKDPRVASQQAFLRI